MKQLLVVLVALGWWLGFLPVIVGAEGDACTQTCTKSSDDNDQQYLSCISQKKSCLEERIKSLQSQKVTLTSTISIFNGKIAVQELQIKQIEDEIDRLERQISQLSQRIDGLNVSLDRLSAVLVERVKSQYEVSRVNKISLVLAATSLRDSLFQATYLEELSRLTAQAMERAETQRITYDEQKAIKEEKQQEVEKKQQQLLGERSVLTKQRAEQQFLLKETQNDEQKYQAELAKTLAEISAIQSIIAGKGAESEAGTVKTGDQIASIISGASVCSTGTHLHFEVVKDKVNRDPSGYLKSASITWNNQPDGNFGFGGSWDWPVNDPARITQGYGMTYYARVRRAYGGSPHTGLDITSKSGDLTVKAVQDGKLYRGSIPCGRGNLRYVRVAQADGWNTYYLHVNY